MRDIHLSVDVFLDTRTMIEAAAADEDIVWIGIGSVRQGISIFIEDEATLDKLEKAIRQARALMRRS